MRRLFLLWLSCGLLSAGSAVILPFANLSGNPNLDWVGESIAVSIRWSLTGEGLLVLDRDSRNEVFRRLSLRPNVPVSRASILKIGEALDTDQIVYGSFTVDADPASPAQSSVKIAAHVLHQRRMQQSPEYSVLGALDDLASLENRLAWQTLRYLSPDSSVSEQDFLRRHSVVRLDAMEVFIRGLITTNPEQQHRLFTQAARLDPKFSQPCFELGRMQWEKKQYRVAAEWLQRVTPEDAHYREAVFLLGLCRYYLADYAGSETAFQMVAQSVPLNEVLNNLGAAQSRLNSPAALATFQKALDGDESDPDYHFNIGYVLWKRGDFDKAAEKFRAVLDRLPDDQDAITLLGRCLKRAGPRQGDPRSEGVERLKHTYEESAYRQLKAFIEK